MSDYKFFEDMGVRVFDNGHSFSGVHFSIHSKYSAIPAYDDAMKAAYGEERTRADPRPGAPQHGVLPEPHDQGRDPGDPRRQADRRRQDADRELDLPPEGRAARAAAAHHHVQPADQLAVLGRRPRRPAGLPRHPGRACMRAATSGSACTATSIPPRSARREVTTIGTSEISMRNQYRAWAQLHDGDDVSSAMSDVTDQRPDRLRRPRGAPARRQALRRVERALHRRRASTGCRWCPTRPTASTTPRTSTRTSCCASCASSG